MEQWTNKSRESFISALVGAARRAVKLRKKLEELNKDDEHFTQEGVPVGGVLINKWTRVGENATC